MNDIVSPLQSTSYTNKDFVDIYTELLDLTKQLTSKWDPSISNESDPGVVLLKLNAVIADKNNYSIDKSVLETFPMSVTQQSNARKLFSQLGYYMHWYRSAYTDVSIRYTGDRINSSVIIDPFTLVTDNDNNVIYTLIGNASVPSDTFEVNKQELSLTGENEVTFKAIQGLPVTYELNGNSLIKSSDLDGRNRIYFDTNQVAENGIFICNFGLENYSEWKKKDNLLIENLGNRFYKFGVSDDGTSCYLEFPEDAAEIFNEGINITYIKTDATYGDVSRSYLSKFYNNLTLLYTLGEETLSITLDNTNTSITNLFASVGSSEEETINDAYRGYKRTVGTFDTLVTLRDYINYLINNDLTSNCIVCDRNNDIQTSYKVVTNNNEIDNIVTYHNQNSDNQDLMNAFSLKFYLLTYIDDKDINRSDINYSGTFILLTNDELNKSKEYIKSSKSLNHDIVDILECDKNNPNICLFKNKYTISCRIIPQSNLNDLQKNEVIENIKVSLRNGLNSKKLEFGEEPSYDLINKLIIDADERIKFVNLNNIDYNTFAVYFINYKLTFDSNKNGWYDDYYNRVDPSIFGLDIHNPIDGATQYIPLYSEVDINSDPIEYSTDMRFSDGSFKLVYPNSIKINENKLYNILKANNKDLYEKIEFEYGLGWNYTQDGIDYSAAISIENIGYVSGVTYSKGDRFYEGEDILDRRTYYTAKKDIFADQNTSIQNLLNLNLIGESDFSPGDKFCIRLSHAFQFSTDIYAKSVLNGKTNLFSKNGYINYNIDTYTENLIDNIEKIEPNVDIRFEFDESTSSTYVVRENESLQFYYPNLIEANNYSNYVKYEYYITSDVPANTDYQLKPGEYIAFYYKNNTVDSLELYIYHIYGNNSIINSNFALSAQSDTNTVAFTYGLLDYKDGYPIDSSTENNGAMSEECSTAVGNIDDSLSGTKKIVNKKINRLIFDPNETQYLFYWITNNKQNNRYYLFDNDTDTEKILEVGEYFFYSNKERTAYEILGAGTSIVRNLTDVSNNLFCVAIDDLTNLMNGNQDMSSLFSNISYTLTATENVYQILNRGCTVKLEKTNNDVKSILFNKNGYSVYSDNPVIEDTTLDDFNISYKLPQSNEWVNIVPLELSDDIHMNGRTRLNLSVGPNKEQYLLSNQSIICYHRKEDRSISETLAEADHLSINIPIALDSNGKILGGKIIFRKTGGTTEEELTGDSYTATYETSGSIITGIDIIFNSDPLSGDMTIFYNQTIFKISGEDRGLLNPEQQESISNPYCYPVCLQTSFLIMSNLKTINTEILDSYGNYNYLSIFNYKRLLDYPLSGQKQISYSKLSTIYVSSSNSTVSTVDILLSLPEGDYIFELNHSIDNLTNFTCSYGTTIPYTTLSTMSGKSSDFKTPGTYYIKLHIDYNEKSKLHFTLTGVSRDSSFKFGNCFRYIPKIDLSGDRFNQIFNRLVELDRQDLYKYIYEVPESVLINNPLNPKSFLNSNHIYNEFTICEMNTPVDIKFG